MDTSISVYADLSWRQRLSIVLNLTWSDIVARYGGGILGMAWLILSPLMFFLVAYIVFGHGLGVSWTSDQLPKSHRFGAPFFLAYSCHILLSDGVSQSLSAFKRLRGIVRVSSLPTPLVFISGFLTSQTRGLATLLIAIIYSVCLRVPSVDEALIGLMAVLLVMFFVASASSVLSSFAIFIPDLQFVMPTLLRIIFYATPIVYPLSFLPENLQRIEMLNPMTVLVETLRRPLLFGQEVPWQGLLIVFIASAALMALGYFVFHRINRFLHDLI
jgi:ABC-type polysaccharide/polyol phosphate export permease